MNKLKKMKLLNLMTCKYLSEMVAVSVMEPITQGHHHSETIEKISWNQNYEFYSTVKNNFSIFESIWFSIWNVEFKSQKNQDNNIKSIIAIWNQVITKKNEIIKIYRTKKDEFVFKFHASLLISYDPTTHFLIAFFLLMLVTFLLLFNYTEFCIPSASIYCFHKSVSF